MSYHVRVLEVVQNGNVVELDVEVLVDALQGSTDRDVILEFDRNLLKIVRLWRSYASFSLVGLTGVNEGFEETKRPSQPKVAIRFQSHWGSGDERLQSETLADPRRHSFQLGLPEEQHLVELM